MEGSQPMGPLHKETLMPIHLPMKVNKDEQGPLNDNEKGHYVCWCSEGAKCEELWEYWDVQLKGVHSEM